MTVLCSPTRQNPFLVFRHSLFKSNTQDVSQDNLLCAAETKKQGHWRGECTKYLTLQLSQPHTGYHNPSRSSSHTCSCQNTYELLLQSRRGLILHPCRGTSLPSPGSLIVMRTNCDQD